MTDNNKEVVRHTFEELLNRKNFEIIDERFASDYIGHAMTEIQGPDGNKQFAVAMRSAFPDLQFTIDDEIAEGDRVVQRWTVHGTHVGEFLGIPPSGEQVIITGISVYRVADGKMVEGWTNANMPRMEEKQG